MADSKPLFDAPALLGLDIEDPEHHFVSRMSNHPASLRIYSPRDVAAQFEKLNADAI